MLGQAVAGIERLHLVELPERHVEQADVPVDDPEVVVCVRHVAVELDGASIFLNGLLVREVPRRTPEQIGARVVRLREFGVE